MERVIRFTTVLSLTILMSSCGLGEFKEHADQQFGDQHFKTSISLIEMYKLRMGEYPSTLKDLKYTGSWDKLALSSVKYTRLDEGYELDLTRGWIGKPSELEYPDDFWIGLGLVNSNLKSQD